METSEYNYSEEDFNNINKPEVFIAETDDNEFIDDKISSLDMTIFIEELCYSINKLKDTSNKTILLAFFQNDKNQPVIIILSDFRKFKEISLEAEISEIKDTLFKVNAMFRMCLILDIDDCIKYLKPEIKNVIKHAYLTKTEKDDDLHRDDNLYKGLTLIKPKQLRKEGTNKLKERFQIKKFDSVLLSIYSIFFKAYSERSIRESLRL